MKSGSVVKTAASVLGLLVLLGPQAFPQAGQGNLILSGWVRAEDGSPASGARVVVMLRDEKKGMPRTHRETLTDAKGKWAVPFIRKGIWDVSAFTEETMSEIQEVLLNSNRGDVVLVLTRKADDFMVEAKSAIYAEDFAKAGAILSWFAEYFPRSRERSSALFWTAFVDNRRVQDADRSWESVSLLEKAVQSLDSLIAKFPSSPWREDAEVLRIDVALRLYRRGVSRYGDVIRKSVSTPDPGLVHVRLAALDALLSIERKQAFERLKDIVIHDPDPEIRKKAILILGRLGDKEAKALLEEVAAKDPDAAVRSEAQLWAARRISPPDTRF